MTEKIFTWVNTHNQLVEFLETKEKVQKELIDLLKSVGIQPFNDKTSPESHDVELDEIDPFTFFCYIYKYGSQKRLEFLQKIASKLDIEVPSDEKGIPSAQAQKVWLFPYKFARKNNEISRLWSFFKKVLKDRIIDEDFEDILKINNIGKTKLTEALFYIKPEKYLPINGPTKPYIEEELNITPSFNSYSEYIALLNQIQTKISIPFYELSYRAWEWNNKRKAMDNSSKYSKQLLAFLEQAKTDNLKTKHFTNSYKETLVKVSFGQGVTARVPWISFLKEPNTTSKGIYPVYLLYKELNKLILAYGISETNKPNESWDIQNPKTISDFFAENNLGKPDRYGTSYIYKVYDVEDLPNEEKIDSDLDKLIEFYLNNKPQNGTKFKESVGFDKQHFINGLNNSGLLFSPKLVTRFVSSLFTKPFLILTGLSGSGKTKLAQAFSRWICASKDQFCIVPVGADWTNREPLLGYPNALSTEEYVKPDNGVLDLLIRANNNPGVPHFLILDEMNLSHVERYFADFLSVMESNEEINLYSGGNRKSSEGSMIPQTIGLPKNLFLIGTVNIDETTYMFSPKVLDRANVIEFRVSSSDIEEFLKNPKSVNIELLDCKGFSMSQSFLELASNQIFVNEDMDVINETLVGFFKELKKLGAEFGYRSANEIVRLINQLGVIDSQMNIDAKIDIAIMQKLLPKLHGSRRKLCPVLLKLGEFCLDGKIEKIETEIFGKDESVLTDYKVKYPISLEKIIRMYNCAVENGFASYAEA